MNQLARMCIAVTAIVFFFLTACQQQTSLIDIQNEYLFAETDAGKERAIDHLYDYYRDYPIPDSLYQNKIQNVSHYIDTVNIALLNLENIPEDLTQDKIETKLAEQLNNVILLKLKGDHSNFLSASKLTDALLSKLDTSASKSYWKNIFQRVSIQSSDKLRNWILAKSVYITSKGLLRSGEKTKLAECYAVLGLHLLRQTPDERLRLDFVHILQYILYEYYSLNDISAALTDREFQNAMSVNYLLRANALVWNRAVAFQMSGLNIDALEQYKTVIDFAKQHSNIPLMNWFETNASISLAEVYWEMSQFQKAQEICDQFRQSDLFWKEKLNLHILRGLLMLELGNYETAEQQYKNALDLAVANKDTLNMIIVYNNLASLNNELTEHNKALKLNVYAQQLLDGFMPENPKRLIEVIKDMAEIKFKMGQTDEVEILLLKAERLLSKTGNLPQSQVDLLAAIGDIKLQLLDTNEAIFYFTKADSICEQWKLIRVGLKIKLNLADCLVRKSEFESADNYLSEVIETASEIKAVENMIDAFALKARSDYLQHDIDSALNWSGQMLEKIEQQSKQFSNLNRLKAYRQKIYDYLKDSIVYRLNGVSPDSAFMELDFAKSFALTSNANNDFFPGKNTGFHDLQDHLPPRSLLISPMITADTLYTFVLSNENLQCYRKPVSRDSLQKYVSNYIQTINQTIVLFGDYNITGLKVHFEKTVKQASRLYKLFFNWSGADSQLEEADFTYIIPDEFLYELPFSTLVTGLNTYGRPTYLVEKTALVNIPGHSSFYRKEKSVGQTPKSTNALLSADLNFPQMSKFVSSVNNLIPETTILTAEEGINDPLILLKRVPNDRKIIVFSGHSVANRTDPDLSYIEVAVANSKHTSSKIYRMNWQDLQSLDMTNTEIVLLVGCETAGGKLYRGSGIVGIQSSILAAGANNVIASLWKIDASQSLPQAIRFLRQYLDHSNTAKALQSIQLSAIRQLENDSYFKFPYPYFWGSYVLYTRSI